MSPQSLRIDVSCIVSVSVSVIQRDVLEERDVSSAQVTSNPPSNAGRRWEKGKQETV